MTSASLGIGSDLLRGISLTPPARGRRRPAPDGEELDQREPRDKAADVRRVGHAALLRAAAEDAEPADELEEEPQPERDVSRHGRQEVEEDDPHPVVREEQDVAAEYARDGPRRAEAWHEQR